MTGLEIHIPLGSVAGQYDEEEYLLIVSYNIFLHKVIQRNKKAIASTI